MSEEIPDENERIADLTEGRCWRCGGDLKKWGYIYKRDKHKQFYQCDDCGLISGEERDE